MYSVLSTSFMYRTIYTMYHKQNALWNRAILDWLNWINTNCTDQQEDCRRLLHVGIKMMEQIKTAHQQPWTGVLRSCSARKSACCGPKLFSPSSPIDELLLSRDGSSVSCSRKWRWFVNVVSGLVCACTTSRILPQMEHLACSPLAASTTATFSPLTQSHFSVFLTLVSWGYISKRGVASVVISARRPSSSIRNCSSCWASEVSESAFMLFTCSSST